ncbi:hypothetical protein [Microbacterium sp.]|uniref:hypothetical protein n=1 Tax=Microbacterium sp. TaxID=51671 RepID=UPI003F6E9BC7
MSRIRMRVIIRNDTDSTLVWLSDHIDSGEWNGNWIPPRQIGPRSTAEFRAEGDLAIVPTSGTEGWVRYRADGDAAREFYIHWNSPLIEGAYGNTFHVWAPPAYDASTWGGQGHEAELTVRFRSSVEHRVPGFAPSIHGLNFSNHWDSSLPVIAVGYLWNRLLDELPGAVRDLLQIVPVDDNWLPITHADAGLCGGMVFAVKDYYAANRYPPSLEEAPSDANDPLFIYIRDRLVDSFDIFGAGDRWLGYSSPHYPNGDEGVSQSLGFTRGRSWVTYREEWPKIRDDIDNGVPSPIGLIRTDNLDIGINHQVLAYGYQQDGQSVRLLVYDPNLPNDDKVTITFDITDTAGEVHAVHASNGQSVTNRRIFAIIRTEGYNPHAPVAAGTAHTVRQALELVTGRDHGRLPDDANAVSLPSVRGWLKGLA